MCSGAFLEHFRPLEVQVCFGFGPNIQTSQPRVPLNDADLVNFQDRNCSDLSPTFRLGMIDGG